jgi:MFS family permease
MKLSKIFPTFGQRNIAVFYIHSISVASIFFLSNWVFFFKGYLSISEIAFIDGAAILIGVLMELPSGVIADLLGKKKSLIIGYLIMIISMIYLGLSDSFMDFLISNALYFVGFSFVSGADEALAYDSMLQHGLEKSFDIVSSKAHMLRTISTIAAIFIGGILFAFDPTFPVFYTVIPYTIGLTAALFAREPSVDTIHFSLRNYIRHFKIGFANIAASNLRAVSLFTITILMLAELSTGIVRQNTGAYFSLGGSGTSYAVSAGALVTAVFLGFLPRIRKKFPDKTILLFMLFIIVISFSVSFFSNMVFIGVFVLVFREVVIRSIKPMISILSNKYIDSKSRATTLSTIALLGFLPYVLITILFGNIFELGRIQEFFLAAAVVSGIIFSILVPRRLSPDKIQR